MVLCYFFLSFLFYFSVCVVTADGDVSQNAEVDLSCSGLTELDLGADEVFIVSSPASPTRLPFARHAVRTSFLSLDIPWFLGDQLNDILHAA